MDAYLSASQLGITVASLVLGWVGEPVFTRIIIHLLDLLHIGLDYNIIHKIAIIGGIALITILHMVLGEQVPKTFGIRNPLETSMLVSYPLRMFYLIFRPFIWTINGLTRIMLRLLGLRSADEHDGVHSEEELRMLLTESEEGGAIKQSEHELIQNVFEFDDRVVRNIMVPRTKISAIDLDGNPEDILDQVVEDGYSRMPVYHDSIDNISGILYTKDLLKLIKKGTLSSEYIEKIIRPAHFIPQTKQVNALLREFQTLHIQIAIVTNEFGGIAGMVTMEDIIEELVGEIQDEYDEEKPPVEKLSDTEFVVSAMATLSDVNEVLPVALPESPHYESVSGLLNYIFGRIPAVNEKREFGGYEFTVLKRFRHSVESVKMVVLDPGFTPDDPEA
jgi:CBS domain containing-hemolysin-like protein